MITGASRGIGAACARRAAALGWAVCVNYASRRDAADALVARIGADGGRAVAVQADVGDAREVVRLFEACDAALGRVTDVINNAGIVQRAHRVEDIDADELARLLQVNLFGAIIVAREAVRRMSTRRGGTGGVIVNVSSAAARIGSANDYVDYAAAKAAIDTLTLGLAREVATEGIRVVGIRPGIIDTEIHASTGQPGRLERLSRAVPIGRAGSADEIAEVAMFLLGPGASYVTGTTVDVTGGR
ncbi:MAG: SDR family oxidoreductase [Lautropia sp.]